MKLRFNRQWMRYKPGDETESVRDGVANSLIRGKIAVLVAEEPAKLQDTKPQVEEVEDVSPVKLDEDDREQADAGDGADERADNAERSETPVVSGGVRHKPRRGNRKPNPGGS